MNPSAKAAGLPFQLSGPTGRDGSIFEQRSDVRSHDGDPASRTSSEGTRVCSYSDCEILYPATAYLPEPRESSVIKVHSRLLGTSFAAECLYLCSLYPTTEVFPCTTRRAAPIPPLL